MVKNPMEKPRMDDCISVDNIYFKIDLQLYFVARIVICTQSAILSHINGVHRNIDDEDDFIFTMKNCVGFK